MKSRRVLIVAADARIAHRLIAWATSEGHETRFCSVFAEAREELETRPPDLFITEVRLGEYNGFHLVIRAQWRGCATPTIIVGEPDAQLETEARQLGVEYLPRPLDPEALAGIARAMLETTPPTPAESREPAAADRAAGPVWTPPAAMRALQEWH
jgi:DNA-binding response OmpR family regulator